MEVKQVVPGCPSPATPITHTKIGNFEILAYASDSKVVIMTSQLSVLQILDLPWRAAQMKHDAESQPKTTSSTSSFSSGYFNPLGSRKSSSTPVAPQPTSNSAAYKKSKVAHLEWQGQGRGSLAVCIANCVILFHPVSKRQIVKKAEKEAPQLLPALKGIMAGNVSGTSQDERKGPADATSTLPCIIPTSVLSHPALKLETLPTEDIVDLCDLLFQERMTIVHDFSPSCVSFTRFENEGEYILVAGGESLVLWKLRSQVLDPPERARRTTTPSTTSSFTPATRLGARIGINGIAGLTFNSKLEKPKPAQLSSSTQSRSTESPSPPPIPPTSVPWGNVAEWYSDEDDDGNSLFPNSKTPYRQLWRKTVPFIRSVSFSPAGRVFATVGHHDRHVKVWYYGENGLTFTYLPHPRAVADIQWRRYHAKREFSRNVLMTRAVDGTCMLWEESEPTSRLEFSLRLTLTEAVTSVQWLLPPVAYLTDILDDHAREREAKRGQSKSSTPARMSAYVPSHAPSSSSSSFLPLNQNRSTCPFDSQHRTISVQEKDKVFIAPLNSSPKETQDWVVALQKDGSILLWKVKGLGVPKRVATATLWSRLRHVLAAKVDDFYPHLVVISQRFAFKEKVYHPALLNVYTSSASKRDIACWTVDTSLINRAQAVLSRRLQGHVSQVNSLQAHPGVPLLVSADKYRTVIWKITDTTISDSTFVLQDICGLPASKHTKWDPLDPIIYMYIPPVNRMYPNDILHDKSEAAPADNTLAKTNQKSMQAKEGIVAYLIDHCESDSSPSPGAWAGAKALGTLDSSVRLEDDHGNPVQLGHLEVLPPVYFEPNGTCKKLASHESLLLGACQEGRVIYIWKITKSMQKTPVATQAPKSTRSSKSLLPQKAHKWSADDTARPSLVSSSIHVTTKLSNSTSYLSPSSSKVRVTENSTSKAEEAYSNSTSTLKSRLIVKYVLPKEAQMSCLAKPVSTHIRDMRQHQSDASLFTGGFDGIVRAWRLQMKPKASDASTAEPQDEFEWMPLLYFRAHNEPVEVIRCASFGRMATTSQSGEEIKIWECESSSPNFLLEDVIKSKLEEDKRSASRFNTDAGNSAASSIMKKQTSVTAPSQALVDEYVEEDEEDDEDGLNPTICPIGSPMIGKSLLHPSDSYLVAKSSRILPTRLSSFNFGVSSSSSLLKSSNSSLQSDNTHSTQDRETNFASKAPVKPKCPTVFDWISGPTGSPMLAVVSGNTTRVFAQKTTKDFFEFKPIWTSLATARVSGSAVAWTGLGQLVVAQGNRLLVFTNWLDDCTLTTITERWHSALPYYHPKVIFELVMAGRIDRAHAVFKALHASLKESVPDLFNTIASSSDFTNVEYKDDDEEYTAELLKNHPDLQPIEHDDPVEETEEKKQELFDENGIALQRVPALINPLQFDMSQKLLDAGVLYLTQKQLGIKREPVKGADANSANATAPIVSGSPIKTSQISASPGASMPDPISSYDPTAYDPTATPKSSKDKGLFDDSSDEENKADAWNSYASRMDEDRYNIGGNYESGSDSGDDFWGDKKSQDKIDLSRFGDDPYAEPENADDTKPQPSNPAPIPVGPSTDIIQKFEWNFELISEEQASELIKVLPRVDIKGLESAEQAYLIALIETLGKLEHTWLDRAAVRFTVMTRFFLWMQRTNKIPQNASVPSLILCWALHTGDQQALVEHCFPNSSVSRGVATAATDSSNAASKFPLLWDTVRSLGIPLWLTDLGLLKKICQDLATQHFLIKKDPADAALWYLLLGKKSALAALYKVNRDDKIHGFLSNDFTQPRWKSAAQTNAFVLVSKQQLRMAVGFFVLAGNLADAIDICLTKLDDYMLALFVARIVQDNDKGEQVQRVLKIGLDKARQTGDQQMESTILWLQQEYKAALGSLIPQAPHTTVILASNISGSQVAKMDSNKSNFRSPPTRPRSRSSSLISPKEKKKSFDTSDEDQDYSSEDYDYRQFDIRTGMSDIYGPDSFAQDSASYDGDGDDTSNSSTRECTNPLYQHHEAHELTPATVQIASVTPNFNPGIRSLFDFVFTHPRLKIALQEAEKLAENELNSIESGGVGRIGPWNPQYVAPAGRAQLTRSNSKLAIMVNRPGLLSRGTSTTSFTIGTNPSASQSSTGQSTSESTANLIMMGELRMKDFLKRKMIYTYIHAGLSRILLQQDLDELDERVSNINTSLTEGINEPIEEWALDASQSKVVGVGSELVARELEFKCAVQFLSQEIESNRSLQKLSSLDTYNLFLKVILSYHSALTPDSIVAALGQFCEHRLYLFHHYVLLRTSSSSSPIIYSSMESSVQTISSLEPIPAQALVTADQSSISSTNPTTSSNSSTAPSQPTTPPSSVRDPSAAGQLLIRTAQKITSLCQTLVTNPLSPHQAFTTQMLANELATCLELHVSDPTVSFSSKARAGVGAAVRLGLFVAAWSNKDYDCLLELLSSKPTLSNPKGQKEEGMIRLTGLTSDIDNSAIPDLLSPTARRNMLIPSQHQSLLSVPTSSTSYSSAPSSPAPNEPTVVSNSIQHMFPTRQEAGVIDLTRKSSRSSEPLSAQTELFFSRLLDVVLLVKFTNQQEEFLSGSFPNPGSLNLIKTLKQWMLQLENQLKDIPVQIIEERLQEIVEKESRFVFDVAFFAPFIRETVLYEHPCAPKLWQFLASQQCVTHYLHSADYLKQSMRFVRMHSQLRDDFDEHERNQAVLISTAWKLNQRSPTEAKSSMLDLNKGNKLNIKLGEPLALFKSKDMVQSFCINPTCRKQVAIATTHGIVEINVEHKAPIPFDSIGSSPTENGGHRRTNSDPSVQASIQLSNSNYGTPSPSHHPTHSVQNSLTTSLTQSGTILQPYDSYIEKEDTAIWLEPHPTLPFYLSSSIDGAVKLWQFNVAQPSPLIVYRSKTKGKSTRVRFNHNGNKFASINNNGVLEMWRFDANEDSVDPFLSLPYLKKGSDVAYLNAGSVLAVAGEGLQGKNVGIVDTLIAPNKSLVATFNAHESGSGSSCIAYSPRHQLIFSGGVKGHLVICDVRQQTVLTTIDTHSKSIKDLFIDPSQSFLVSGSSDGVVRFWNMQTFKEITSWSNAHVAKGFAARAGMSSNGVNQIKLSRNSIYSCGADGKLSQRRYSALETK